MRIISFLDQLLILNIILVKVCTQQILLPETNRVELSPERGGGITIIKIIERVPRTRIGKVSKIDEICKSTLASNKNGDKSKHQIINKIEIYNKMELSSPKTIENNLKPFLTVQKTIAVEYQIITLLLKVVKVKPQIAKTNTFISLYTNLSPEIKTLPLYEYLQYRLWSDESIPLEVREKTKFFHMVSNWIVHFQLKVGKLMRLKGQFKFLADFFEKETSNMFEKIILFDQIYDDLTQFISPVFWGKTNVQNQQDFFPTKQDAEQVLKFISTLTYYQSVTLPNSPTLHENCISSLILGNMHRYNEFMLRSLFLLLQVKGFDSSQETELSRICLIFLQRPNLKYEEVIDIIKLLMIRTSKPVRYALIVEYVRFYQYLEISNQQVILQTLQDIIYFRQLIIGRQQIDEAGLIFHTLGPSLHRLWVPARTKNRVFISQQPSYGKETIIQMQILVESADINLALVKIDKGKQSVYWKQEKSQDRRVDILLKEEGLYALEFDNTYSWLKGKGVSYKIEQYKSVELV